MCLNKPYSLSLHMNSYHDQSAEKNINRDEGFNEAEAEADRGRVEKKETKVRANHWMAMRKMSGTMVK